MALVTDEVGEAFASLERSEQDMTALRKQASMELHDARERADGQLRSLASARAEWHRVRRETEQRVEGIADVRGAHMHALRTASTLAEAAAEVGSWCDRTQRDVERRLEAVGSRAGRAVAVVAATAPSVLAALGEAEAAKQALQQRHSDGRAAAAAAADSIESRLRRLVSDRTASQERQLCGPF
eukprot:TRINITY_DN15305_c0_g1_i1.p2 TRINITY_DN15305_c0_g1~~TRINITY_DN15305_c0_g1_i1.p2  ORF type:complete len:197 (+),score=58.80 TRINITY_DN15305_c0_g1_i1:41-592(+)